MVKSLSKLIFSFLLLGLSATSHAGGIGGGGGDGVVCNGGPFMLFLDKRFYLSDLLTGTTPTFYEKTFQDTPEDVLTEAVLRTIEKTYPEVREAYNALKFTVVKKIPNVDTGVKISLMSRIFNGCRRKMIAYQNLETHEVFLKNENYSKLPTYLRVLVKIHETYINYFSAQTKEIIALETLARERVSKIVRDDAYNSGLAPNVVALVPTTTVNELLTPWLRYQIFTEYSHYLPQYVIENNLPRMVGAGLDVNGKTYCEFPIVLYALGHNLGGSFARMTAAKYFIDEQKASLDVQDLWGARPIHWATKRAIYKWNEVGDNPKYYMEDFNYILSKTKNINEPWCWAGAKEGQLASTPLDMAKRARAYGLEDQLKKSGAKTAAELNLHCPEGKGVTQEMVDKFQCMKLKYDVMWWQTN